MTGICSSRPTTHTSSAPTQKLLGCHPTHTGLMEVLAEGHYFQI